MLSSLEFTLVPFSSCFQYVKYNRSLCIVLPCVPASFLRVESSPSMWGGIWLVMRVQSEVEWTSEMTALCSRSHICLLQAGPSSRPLFCWTARNEGNLHPSSFQSNPGCHQKPFFNAFLGGGSFQRVFLQMEHLPVLSAFQCIASSDDGPNPDRSLQTVCSLEARPLIRVVASRYRSFFPMAPESYNVGNLEIKCKICKYQHLTKVFLTYPPGFQLSIVIFILFVFFPFCICFIRKLLLILYSVMRVEAQFELLETVQLGDKM